MSSLGDLSKRKFGIAEKEPYVEPANYKFEHREYHDRTFVVGENISKIEKMSANSWDLRAHSSLFREILAKNSGTEVRISDMSPEVFKLILIHVYGGKLPDVDPATAAQLFLAANSYNILPLVDLAGDMITPSSADDVFPALVCVANMECPNLEDKVNKIVQQQTEKLLGSEKFLDLDAKCIDYIAQQNSLSVTELDLWKALVRWAKQKVISEPGRNLRQHLQTALPYIRFTTFSPEEVSQEVIPTKILSADEVMELLLAISNNQPWEFPGTRNIQKVRKLAVADQSLLEGDSDFKEKFDINCSEIGVYVDYPHYISKLEKCRIYCMTSHFTLDTTERIKIETISVQSKPISTECAIYNLKCYITVCKIEKGFCTESRIIHIGGMVAGDREITFPLALRKGEPVILEAYSCYIFSLKFDTPHPVYKIHLQLPMQPQFNCDTTSSSDDDDDYNKDVTKNTLYFYSFTIKHQLPMQPQFNCDTTSSNDDDDDDYNKDVTKNTLYFSSFTIKHNTPLHVLKLGFKKNCKNLLK